jgi:tRNA(Ile)-lysidine synthase
MLLKAVKETLRTHEMLDPDDRVLVAVSGGIDSIVLLHVLRLLSDDLRLSLVIAHLNHGWRGDTSDDDARFVASLAEEAGLEILTERIDAAELDVHRGRGSEGAAREVRRRFLAEAADAVSATRIALGHTANDRAETILFNLTRGTGSAGLAGIDPINERIIRPLIAVTRDDVRAYAEDNNLVWREDATNEDLTFARNRLRHRVLPELEQVNARAVEAICRAGDLASEAERAEAFLVSTLWEDVALFEEPGEVRFRRPRFAELPPEVQCLVLRDGFRRVRGDLDGIERCHVRAVLDLLGRDDHGDVDLPRVHVRVDRAAVSLSASPFPASTAWEAAVEIGQTTFAERGFALDLKLVDHGSSDGGIAHSDPAIEAADADRIAFPLHVRSRRVGDRFTPLGMDRPIKLKDFLINERVPFFTRDDVPLLCDREKILWVVGVRLSNEIRLAEATRRLLIMRMEPVS